MKKRFLSHFLLFVLSASLLTLALSSCTGFFKDDSGTASVSFTIDHSIFETNTARDASGSGEQYTLVLSLGGDYEDTQTLTWTRGSASTSTIEFDAVPAGCEIYAEAKLFRPRENGTLQQRYYGKSESLLISNGENKLPIHISRVMDTPIVTYQSNGNGIMVYTLDSGSTITTDNYSAGFSFDIDGNFYAFKNDGGDTYKILSDKADYNNSATVDVSSMGGYLPNLTVDLKNNILYTYVCNEWSLEVIKHPLFISSGSTSSSTNKSFNFASVEVGGESVSPVPSLCVVNNGMLYVIANDNSSTNLGAFLYKTSFDEWAGNYGDQVPGGVRINLPYGSISDMYYEDGYLYLLVAQDVLPQYLATNSPIYSRGFIAKYDISSNTIVEMIGGTTNGTPTNTGKLYLYQDRLNLPPYLYRDPEFSIPYTIDKDFSEFFAGASNTVFPEFFVPSDSQKAFRNPAKIIAIKPKKLVIADDGIAFYTDTDGAWYYKNSDRIITVSLDKFAIESISTTNSPFAKVVNRDLISENDIIGSSHFGSEQTYKIYQQGYEEYNPAAASDMKVAIKLKQN